MTRTTRPAGRAVSSIGARVAGRGAATPVHAPNRRSASATTSWPPRSPPTTRVARPGSSVRSYTLRRCAAVKPLDGLAGAAGRPVVRRLGRVDRPDERLLDAAARVGLGLEEVVQALVAQALDLGDREGRSAAAGPRPRARGRRQPVGRHVDADGQRIPAGIGVERGAEPLGGFDEGDRVVALRSPRSGPGRPGPWPRPRSAARRPAADDQDVRPTRAAGRAGRRRGSRGRWRAAAGHGREVVRPRRAGTGRSAMTGPSRGRIAAVVTRPPRSPRSSAPSAGSSMSAAPSGR